MRFALSKGQASFLIRSAARSATIKIVSIGLMVGKTGMMEASQILNPCNPTTLRSFSSHTTCSSTFPCSALTVPSFLIWPGVPILQEEEGW
mgnify:CR=1 FL=1